MLHAASAMVVAIRIVSSVVVSLSICRRPLFGQLVIVLLDQVVGC